MQHRTGPRRLMSTALPFTAAGRMRVDYTDGFGNARGRLDNVRTGLFVVATGTIRSLHLHGDDDAPRATFTLMSDDGESAIVAIGTTEYLESFGLLIDGQPITVHGTVVRPFQNSPAHIQTVSIHQV
jgi:hypothetical protein